MGALADLEAEAKDLHDRGQFIKMGVLKQIEALPINSKIKRLSGRIFTMKFSDLSSENWTPRYYDFELQYKELSEFLDKKTALQVAGALRKIIKDKGYTRTWYCVGGSYKETIKVNPQVVEHLKTLL